jgi:hypothetical protein
MSIDDFSITKEIYDEIMEKIKCSYEQEKNNFNSDIECRRFIDNYKYELSKDIKYYEKEIMLIYDSIIELLDGHGMLDNIKPVEMTKDKIVKLVLNIVNNEVIDDFYDNIEEDIDVLKRLSDLPDYTEDVAGKEIFHCDVTGECLKGMGIGEYFNHNKIDDEEIYYITFYIGDKEEGCWSDCYFKIEELNDRVHYVRYNTSSIFALELSNII